MVKKIFQNPPKKQKMEKTQKTASKTYLGLR